MSEEFAARACRAVVPQGGTEGGPAHRSFSEGGRGGRVVYRGGLENRFGVTANGGSNPSLSASFCCGATEAKAGWLAARNVRVSPCPSVYDLIY